MGFISYNCTHAGALSDTDSAEYAQVSDQNRLDAIRNEETGVPSTIVPFWRSNTTETKKWYSPVGQTRSQ